MKMTKWTAVLMAAMMVWLFASCDQPSGGEETPVTRPYEVGDIVFNDGSAMPYADFAALDEDAKTAKKAAAIAIIFYKGTECSNDTTSRTLGVGLKRRSNIAWCTSGANARNTNITTIQCKKSGDTISGDKNGKDNLKQIGDFLADSSTDDTATEAYYPAFYFAKNYSDTATNLGTSYKDGWYLPSIAELFQIYKNGKGASKTFDIDKAIELCGGDQFGTSYYWSSSQSTNISNNVYKTAYRLYFGSGDWGSEDKDVYNWDSVCAVRAFN